MKQLVILSGKGGTGKTSLTAAFAQLASQSRFAGQVVLADADVDAANLELLLQPHRVEEQEFWGGRVAVIDQQTCAGCGDCQRVCRFDAIQMRPRSDAQGEEYWIDPISCDGCAACVYQCPTESIVMKEQVVGKFYASDSRYGPLYHADLFPGQENSGKLVTLVKQRARLQALDEQRLLVLVDGPPGIGCPVISATSGADLALIVAEPTVAGTHDMHRILQTVEHFGVPAMVCINKADIYPEGAEQIETFCQEHQLPMIGRIPFDASIVAAILAGEPVTAFQPESPASLAIAAIWEGLIQVLWQDNNG